MRGVRADCPLASVAAKVLLYAHGESLDSSDRASASISGSGMERVAPSFEPEPIVINCSGCGTFTGRHMNALTTLNVVVLAPIPRPRISITATENKGARRTRLNANCKSFKTLPFLRYYTAGVADVSGVLFVQVRARSAEE